MADIIGVIVGFSGKDTATRHGFQTPSGDGGHYSATRALNP
jgi:hypothetical protein